MFLKWFIVGVGVDVMILELGGGDIDGGELILQRREQDSNG